MKLVTKHFVILLVCILCLLSVKPVFAASLTYTTSVTPTQLVTNQSEIPVIAKLALSAADGTIYYLRGVFSKAGSTNYCGLTWNGNSYYSGPYSTNEGWKNFLKITIQDNAWEGELKVRLDPEDSGCRESGNYIFKLERFTESGSGSFDAQEGIAFAVTLPSPTPTVIPTLKPTATPRPTPTPKTPTPSKQTVITVTSTQIATPNNDGVVFSGEPVPDIHYEEYAGSSEAVLSATDGDTEFLSESPSPTRLPVKVLGSSSLSPFIFSMLGVGMLVLCAILSFRIYKKEE